MARLSDTPLPAPPFPEFPEGWLHDADAREAGRAALRAWRDAHRRWRAALPSGAVPSGSAASPDRGGASMGDLQWARFAPAERLAGARRRVRVSLLVVAGLVALNLATTPQFFWATFPALGVLVGLARHLLALWQDGVPLGAILGGGGTASTVPSPAAAPARAARAMPEVSANETEAVGDGVSRAVLRGPWGGLVREVYATRAAIRMILARVREDDRALLPDVVPAAEAVVDIIRVHTAALQTLDWEVTSAARPGDVPPELHERRGALAAQCDALAEALETLRTDLTTLRTAL
ncbi:MAG: 2TM domain-containing protein [Gemmatimonadota bacterium]|jgi:hypothetical protein|nr:2TM domain-containing protein [Gemmatimonadota bacterium]MDQ8148197.1 2TM domain-containing protein [Gemmatimonadota bacterium]MDQ8157777.1 2TM domain-containing protein [Gemmatimonadota bacterium]